MKVVRQVMMVVLVVILIFTSFVLWRQRGEILSAFVQVSPAALVPPFLLGLLGICLRFLRFKQLVRGFGYRLPIAYGVRYYIAGFAFGLTPGRIGEVLRGGWLETLGISGSVTVLSTGGERLLDLLALGLFAVLGAFLLGQPSTQRTWILIGLLIVGGMLSLLLLFPNLRRRLRVESDGEEILQPRRKDLFGKVMGFIEKQVDILASFKLAPVNLITLIATSLIIWGIGGVVMFWFVHAMGYHDISIVSVIAVYAISVFLGTLSMLPGGVGGTEVSMATLLSAQGLELANAIVVVILVRAFLFWFPLILGAILIPRGLEKENVTPVQ